MPALANSIYLFTFTLSAVILTGCQGREAPVAVTPGAGAGTATGTVTVEIETDDTTEIYEIEDVAAGSTVESVMRKLDEIPVTIHGSGITAFVESIGGKSTSSSEGWTYQVDGEFANRGVGDTTLNPPATITWTFGDSSEIVEATE